MTAADITGVVVAGGRSTRFGDREKALADVAGQPMLRRVVDTLGALCDDIVVNCRPDQRDGFATALDGLDVRFVIDDATDEGPLAGLETGLAAVDTEFAAVLGCDMPLVDPESVTALSEQIGPEDDAVVPTTDGGPEPLHAVYRVEPTRVAAGETLADGERSLRALLERLSVRATPVGEGAVTMQSVLSVDTQEEVAQAEAVLRESE